MKKIKLTIAYDGTNYVGWQIQKNGIAVEQVLNEHLSKLLKEEIVICGASRTDSGVHARGNVATFYTNTRIAPEKISLALNQSLPDDIKIVRSEEVPDDFHPRYANCIKTYQYQILNCRYNVPTFRLYSDYVYYYLDVEKMREAAKYLVGEHDFIAFSSSGGQQKTTVRRIDRIDIGTKWLDPNADNRTYVSAGADIAEADSVEADIAGNSEKTSHSEVPAALSEDPKNYRPKLISVTVSGNGFLYNMVRIIVGTLEKVGMSVYPPEYVKEILESRDRRLSAPKAAARGLTLMGIEYLDI